MEEVVGSIPTRSTNNYFKFNIQQYGRSWLADPIAYT